MYAKSLICANAVLTSGRRRVIVLVTLALAGLVVTWSLVPPLRTVRLHGIGPTAVPVSVRARNVGDALLQAGVELRPQDVVTPPPSAPLVGTADITVRRAVPVSVLVDGIVLDAESAADRVENVLAELGVQLGPDDRAFPDLGDPVGSGVSIRVVRRAQQVAAVETEIPFGTERRADYSMAEGELRTVRAGEPGKKRLTQQQTYEDGQLVRSEILSEEVLAPPVAEVVAYGALGLVSRGDKEYRYVRALDLVATAYAIGDGFTPNAYTYLGLPAKRGVVAVDPSVIPLGTRLYVEGYGEALAADTGGAIKGNRIDLCMDSITEARRFGVQSVRVYILP